MPTAQELGVKLNADREAHGAWLAQQRNPDGSYKAAGEWLEEFNTREAAIKAQQSEYDAVVGLELAAAKNHAALGPQGRMVVPDTKGDGRPQIKDSGDLDIAFKTALKPHADALTALAAGDITKGFPRIDLPVGLKTIVGLSDHYAQALRAQTTPSALYYNSVEDLFASGTIASNNVEYFIQTTDTDNAAMVAEVTAATDSAFSWTKTTDEIENVRTWIPISRNLISDEGFMLSTIQGMLADRLSKLVSKQLMYGTGTTPELWGCSVRSGVQTQAQGSDNTFHAIMKAITLVTVTGDATPDAIVMHPTDWQNIVLERTGDGVYILGNPGNPPANPTLWGLPVRVSTTVAAAAGTAVVGAFRTMAQVFYNGGLTVETSTEHSTYFTEGKIALALHQRLGVAHYRPSAFCKVTGITAS